MCSGVSLLCERHGGSLRTLVLDGEELTDVSLRSIARCCPHLRALALSFCTGLTDAGLVLLAVTHRYELLASF